MILIIEKYKFAKRGRRLQKKEGLCRKLGKRDCFSAENASFYLNTKKYDLNLGFRLLEVVWLNIKDEAPIVPPYKFKLFD